MSIETVRTLNSVYEIDRDAGRVRRLSGTSDPTPRQGPDGEWQNAVVTDGVGGSLLIKWVDKPGWTMTSPVIEVA